MKADFSGYATKAGLKCSDGRTIMPDAFKHQDQQRVPLVWQHGHTDPENVLGHVVLENRDDGVYAYGFFNKSAKAQQAHTLIEHGDINMLSIWANQLIERAKNVLHGAIREVSLVLAGANPGALIENVTIRHADGDDQTLDDEAIIYTGLELELEHASTSTGTNNANGKTVQEIYDTLNEEQKNVVHFMLGEALAAAPTVVTHTDLGDDEVVDETGDKTKLGTEEKTDLGDGTKVEDGTKVDDDQAGTGDITKDNSTAEHGDTNKEGKTMKHNVFEDAGGKVEGTVLSHSDMESILSAAKKGTLKEAVEEYALAHGITDIDTLFPDAKSVTDVPEWNKRRTEWVTELIAAARKSPFARIRTTTADLTMEEARAKGYVTGAMKKEEFFPVARRVTTPTTIYKKQALDRDDVIDITDFDVVAWLKGEMRLMLDEELARAMLIGDGRDISSEDKINEQNIRPIATDNELYTSTITVNVDDASSSMMEVLDAVIMNRAKLKGTGVPTFFTTEYWIARFLLLRDNNNVRMYRSLNDLATELRVDRIVPVEALLETEDIIGIMVNPVDYVLGADKGGQVSMFDDFDIDYNKQKYLIETRVSGALAKLKSAMVIRRTTGTNVLAAPAAPAFDPTTGALTVTNQTGVVYKHGATTINAAGSPYSVPPGETWVVDATPAAGYYFGTSDDDQWSYTADA